MPNSPFDEPDELHHASAALSAAPRTGWSPPPVGTRWLEPADRLKLRLHHLFSLTAVVAVLLAVNGPMQAGNIAAMQPEVRAMLAISLVTGWISTLISAVALMIIAYGIAWRARGIPFFHHPGHWLLAEIAFMAILAAIWKIALRVESTDGVNMGTWTYFSLPLLLIGLLMKCGMNIYISVQICREPRWKWVFATKAWAAILRVVGDLLLVVLLLRAARTDRRTQTLRDSLHWCGVWLQVANTLLWSATILATFFIPYYRIFSR
jgi:hypothetical protein